MTSFDSRAILIGSLQNRMLELALFTRCPASAPLSLLISNILTHDNSLELRMGTEPFNVSKELWRLVLEVKNRSSVTKGGSLGEQVKEVPHSTTPCIHESQVVSAHEPLIRTNLRADRFKVRDRLLNERSQHLGILEASQVAAEQFPKHYLVVLDDAHTHFGSQHRVLRHKIASLVARN